VKEFGMAKQNPKSTSNRYLVGYGSPPRKTQFKPGQSGNPTGARRKAALLAPDVKALLELALNRKTKMRHGEREMIVTKAAAGIDRLVNEFAKGDRHARRDLFALAEKLGVDLTGHVHAVENTLSEVLSMEDEALLADYVRRHSDDRDPGRSHSVVQLRRTKGLRRLTKPVPRR
jgi:hypothetical protein